MVEDFDWFSAAAGATAYQAVGAALGLDSRSNQGPMGVNVRITPPPPKPRSFINARDYSDEGTPGWRQYVGQESLKTRLRFAVDSAKMRGARLDHVLLCGMSGVGKTALTHILGAEMAVDVVELVPRYSAESLAAAAESLGNGDILVLDEIHQLAETDKRGAEVLPMLLDEQVIFLDGEAIEIADITVVGTTTDVDRLPDAVVDRFPIKPYFEKYSVDDLVGMTAGFMGRHDVDFDSSDNDVDLMFGIAEASRGLPRACEEFVLAVRDFEVIFGRKPTIREVLDLQQVEPDGMTRQHVAYLTSMYHHSKRTTKGNVEWVAGESSQRIERFLMESGYIDRTLNGRRLTPAGIAKAIGYVERGSD